MTCELPLVCLKRRSSLTSLAFYKGQALKCLPKQLSKLIQSDAIFTLSWYCSCYGFHVLFFKYTFLKNFNYANCSDFSRSLCVVKDLKTHTIWNERAFNIKQLKPAAQRDGTSHSKALSLLWSLISLGAILGLS